MLSLMENSRRQQISEYLEKMLGEEELAQITTAQHTTILLTTTNLWSQKSALVNKDINIKTVRPTG